MRNILEKTVLIALIERTGKTFTTSKTVRKPVEKAFKEYLPRKDKGLLAPFWWELRDVNDEYVFRGTETDPLGLVMEYLTGGHESRYELVSVPDTMTISFTLILPDIPGVAYLDIYSLDYQRRYGSPGHEGRELTQRFKL